MPRPKTFGSISRKGQRALRIGLEKSRRRLKNNHDASIANILHTMTDTNDMITKQSCTNFNDDNSLNMSHDISYEETESIQITGRRIIEIGYFVKQLQEIGSHNSMFNCNLEAVEFINERRIGLASIFYLKCRMCGTKFVLNSSKDSKIKMDVNEEVVAGIMTVGAGITQLNTILCHINIPPISVRLYQSTHDKICRWWKKTAQHYMAEAAKEEKDHALSIGNTNDAGIATIAVSGDACWSKRSYGTNYCASSGVAAIIGVHSNKVLYFGVKNKVCIICSRANSKGRQPPKHSCFKNFQGPSTAMEAVIITEGFKKSLSTHGLIYNQYVADGDASTYASIRNARPYDNVTVGKIECKNHLLRNYCKGLLSISNNTAYHIRARKILKENYLRIRWGIDSSIKYWSSKNMNFEEKVKNIKFDIINGPYHVFGDHSKCASYFCSKDLKKQRIDVVPELMAYGVFQKVEDLAQRLSLHAYSFACNKTNNAVESFNARVAKFVGGKRVNFTQRGSYLARCAAAVVSYNTGVLQTAVHKHIFNTDANQQIINLEMKRQNRNKTRQQRKKQKTYTKSKIHENDPYYGENCQKVDMLDEQFIEARENFLKSLILSKVAKDKLEKDTILQSGSPLWLETRRKLLTASWFATVCKRRTSTECGPLIKQILYGKNLDSVASIKHGKTNEITAIRELENVLNIKIEQCGLYIDEEFPFLGASPDGRSQLGIIEIKCPYSAHNMEPEDAIKLKKVTFWSATPQNTFKINKSHKWYFQIQGQLRITGQKTCVFAVWTGPGKIKYEMVEKDPQFWKEKMESHLIKFYNNCLLPELIDPRHARNMELRSHSSHIEKNILKIKN